jgi:hypothetical protein
VAAAAAEDEEEEPDREGEDEDNNEAESTCGAGASVAVGVGAAGNKQAKKLHKAASVIELLVTSFVLDRKQFMRLSCPLPNRGRLSGTRQKIE